MKKTRVIVVGAGFAGINAVKELAKKPYVDITLIDKRNHHLFQPLLYQVAMAALGSEQIATPIRSIFSGYYNVDIVMGTVTEVDFKKKQIKTSQDTFPYDYLVLANGANNCYFGHVEWEGFAPGLKSLEDATEIRRRVLTSFEMADREKDLTKQKKLLTFIVVGGGPTGIELAGALAEISRYTLSKDFRNVDPMQTRIILVEAGERILPAFDSGLSAKAKSVLEKMGVTVQTGTMVTSIDSEGITTPDSRIESGTVLWAAGVGPAPLNESLNVKLDRQKRIIVREDLSLEDHPEVFVIGDQAHFPLTGGGSLPALAPVAIQQGKFAGKNIIQELNGKPRKKFTYRDKGIMATIGRAAAVVQVRKLHMTGFIAWATWLFVHIFYLIGFRNRVMVMMQWAWSYLTLKRGARIITVKGWKPTLLKQSRSRIVKKSGTVKAKKVGKKKR